MKKTSMIIMTILLLLVLCSTSVLAISESEVQSQVAAQGKEAVTGIGYEPWHFRYVGSPEIAEEITKRGLCLEEYLENQ